MTRQEFYEKYKDVEFKLYSYNKYTFTFIGEFNDQHISIDVGGNSDVIYRDDYTVGDVESIENLQPYEGLCGEDSFYDY